MEYPGKDLIQSIFQSSQDRMKSPIVGTYIISFIAVNWRAFLILLFSKATIEDKINLINGAYCNMNALLIPLYLTGFYIIILPQLQVGIDAILDVSQKLGHKIAHRKTLRMLETKKEEARLEREVADSRAGTSEINDLNAKVDLLNEQNSILSQQNNLQIESSNKQVNELRAAMELNNEASQLLRKELEDNKKLLSKYLRSNYIKVPKNMDKEFELFPYDVKEYFVDFTDFYILKKDSSAKVEIDSDKLKKLEESKYFSYTFDDDFNAIYELTERGELLYNYHIENPLPF